MVRASGVMATPIARWSFLMSAADEAVEVYFHRARIARNRGQWKEMREHLDTARAMRFGDLPYYVLPDGTQIWISDVKSFFDALPVPDDQHPILPLIQDDARRRTDTDAYIHTIYRLPGFVIDHA